MQDEDYYDEEQPTQERTPSEWAKLRKTEKVAKEAEARAVAAERRLAFLEAGIDVNDVKASYFVKGYDGPVDPEAIHKAALEAGFVSAAAAPDPAVQQASVAQQAIVDASVGAAPVILSGDANAQRLDEAFKTGGTAAMIAELRTMGIPIHVPD